MISFPEDFTVVNAEKPQTAASVAYGDYICCKNAERVYVYIKLAYGADDDVTITLYEATDVAGSDAAAITATHPLWTLADNTSSDVWSRGTDAATVDIDTGSATDESVMIMFDPAKFSAGFDCLCCHLSNSSASNLISVDYIIINKHKQDPPLTVITD